MESLRGFVEMTTRNHDYLYIGSGLARRLVFRSHRRNTWRERVAIALCQVVIPVGLVVGAAVAAGLVFAGCYLIYAVASEMARRGGF